MPGVPKAPQDLYDLLVRPRRTRNVFPVQFKDLPDRRKFHSELQICFLVGKRRLGIRHG